MRRSPSPLLVVRSAIGVLLALVLVGTLGPAPAGAAPVHEQPPLDIRSTGSPPLTVAQDGHAATAPFADVPAGHVFAEEITWLAETGVSTGWPAPENTRQFHPYRSTLRDQMAAFLHRLAGSPQHTAPTTSPFTDVPTDHVFYREISWLAETGVSTGWSGPGSTRQFRPSQHVLRDQMAAFLYRLDPLLPGRDAPVADVVSAHGAAYALTTDGAIWAWGSNSVGQLGNGTSTDSSVPVRVSRLPG